ncbi:MAG TPA: DNA polymerase III subunit gamma/tau [bacterium]|nr:DNA polymerase III subunit gamma/tau [bacterium]
MFYLKYRPQKFSELIKPNPVADVLANQVKTGKVSHAYLFTGSRGTGKTTTARILAKAVNCLSPEKNGDPCDKCENCLAIKNGSFLDLIEIDAASNRGIDDIRSLRERIKLAPAFGKKKVYIIDEVHMLTAEAFNALLKTLEEPPAHAMFILCTTEFSKVPDTIKSRCQSFTLKRATIKQIKEKLQVIAKEEGSALSDKVAEEIARASLGGYRDAETMLQQVLQGNSSTEDFVGAGSYEDFNRFFTFLVNSEPSHALTFVEEKANKGVDIKVWVSSFLDYLKDLLFIKMGVTQGFDDLPEEIIKNLHWFAEKLSVDDILFVINTFISCESALSTEVAVAQICTRWGDAPSVGVLPNNEPEVDPTASPKAASSKSKSAPPVSQESSVEDLSHNEVSVDIGTVKKEWNNILRASTKYNHSVRALLKATQPVELRGNSLVLEAKFAFHKDRLEYSKNREIVEQVLYEVLKEPILFVCNLCQSPPARKNFGETGNLTDLNIAIPSSQDLGSVNIDSSLLDVFDGGLPL